jgi:Bacterial Ig-like domain
MRRISMLLAAVTAAMAQVLVAAPPAHAYEVHISISGAGQVVETTTANLVGSGCTTSAVNPTGVIGVDCFPGDPTGDYGYAWTVRLVATAKPGYRFVQWQSDGSSGAPVLCDGANGSSTYTGIACQFSTFNNLQLRAVFVDDTAPAMTSLSGPNQAVNGPTSFTFGAAADPTIRGYECRVANVHDWESCSSGRTENPASSGLYTFQVRAVDWSGNRSPISSWNWTVDKIAPVATVTSAPSGTVPSTSATFEFTSNESATFSCALDAVSTSCTSPKTFTGVSQGTHTFSVLARDDAGNNSGLVTRTWTVDTVAPQTGLTGGPTEGAKVGSTSASFGLTSTEGASSFNCTLDGAAQPCTAATNLTGLSQGAHTFTAAAVDSVGNTDLTPATRTWTVDTTRPVVSSFGPSGTRVSRTANMSVTFSEAMRSSSIPAAFQLTLGGTKVPATVAYKRTAAGKYIATLDPKRDLKPGKTYKVALRSTALDVAGNGVVAKSWSFRTRA